MPPYYDSLLAKVIAHGADRADALRTMRGALDRCAVEGVTTNLGLQRAVIADPGFAARRRGHRIPGAVARRGPGTVTDRSRRGPFGMSWVLILTGAGPGVANG